MDWIHTDFGTLHLAHVIEVYKTLSDSDGFNPVKTQRPTSIPAHTAASPGEDAPTHEIWARITNGDMRCLAKGSEDYVDHQIRGIRESLKSNDIGKVGYTFS